MQIPDKDFMKLYKYGPDKLYNGWLYQEKFDGVFCALDVRTGKVLSRQRKELYISKLSYLSRIIADMLTHLDPADFDYVLFELTNPDFTLEELSGLVNPNRRNTWPEPAMHSQNWKLHIHDGIQLQGDEDPTPYRKRLGYVLQSIPDGTSDNYSVVSTRVLADSTRAYELAETYFKKGAEGIVLKDPEGGYRCGARVHHQVKLVRVFTADVTILQVEYGKGKRSKQVARMYCRDIDEGIAFWADLGKGWTDAKRNSLTAQYEANPNTLLGTTWVVTGLQKSSTGASLRLPKLLHKRFDK